MVSFGKKSKEEEKREEEEEEEEEEEKQNGFKRIIKMRKRKRHLHGSTATLSSDADSVLSADGVITPPESKRKRKSMARMTSLASVLSTPMASLGHALTRSISGARLHHPDRAGHRTNGTPTLRTATPTKFFQRSFSVAQIAEEGMKAPESPYGTLKRGGHARGSATHLTPYKPPQPTPNKQRPTRYWSSEYPASCTGLSKQEIKMQEAIYEISCGEEDLVDDLKLVQKTYAESLERLKILSAEEVELVFGKLSSLIPVHMTLHESLLSLRNDQNGISRTIGEAMSAWVESVHEPYVSYCASLIKIKSFLDAKRDGDKEFADFLQRCLESPFSRKLDLWSYLDVPRSRLVKYPLLMKQVLKFSDCPTDSSYLASSVQKMESVLNDVDRAMAHAKCQYTLSRLDWLDDSVQQYSKKSIEEATEEMLDGTLRNNRGTKLECHLLDTVLILGRPSSRGHGGEKRLQVYRTPIPIDDLVLEDLDSHSIHGSGGSMGSTSSGKQGSFKSAFSGGSQQVKNSFRVSFRFPTSNHQAAHTLTASDEHVKRQWILVLQKTIDAMSAKYRNASILFEEPEEIDSAKKKPLMSTPMSQAKLIKGRTALFQKNKRSPRIKASLSYAAIESLKRGNSGSKKKSTLATTSSHKFSRTTHSTSALIGKHRKKLSYETSSGSDENTPMDRKRGPVLKPRHPLFHRQVQSSSCLPDKKRSLSRPSPRPLAPIRAKPPRKLKDPLLPTGRERTKSLNQLINGKQVEGIEQEPRYLTRSRHKISKSLNDLLQM